MSQGDLPAGPESYPCEVPVKAMGLAEADFSDLVVAVIRRHVKTIPEGSIVSRPSANGKYVSITVSIVAHSREHLENIYRDLKATGRVLVVL